MKITTEKYARALFESLKNVDEPEKVNLLIKNFISLTVKNNDFYQIDKIFKDFKKKWDQEFRLIKAEVKSVYPIGSDLEKTILDYIKKESKMSQVEIENKIDKEILGGVVIKYDDKIFDASLKTKLNRLRESLLN
jgi:F-type H+-transporting ATPase subunit delta